MQPALIYGRPRTADVHVRAGPPSPAAECTDRPESATWASGADLGVRRTITTQDSLAMEYILSLLVAIAIGVYLFYALLRPERF
jgi:K+-transporting ATPase KdpF subunit